VVASSASNLLAACALWTPGRPLPDRDCGLRLVRHWECGWPTQVSARLPWPVTRSNFTCEAPRIASGLVPICSCNRGKA
jgi:hypothetical protein